MQCIYKKIERFQFFLSTVIKKFEKKGRRKIVVDRFQSRHRQLVLVMLGD